MLVRDFECRSWTRAAELLAGNARRTVCGNTVLRQGEAGISVLLHDNPIILFRIDGRMTIDSCGYRTNTTKDRLNRCLPDGWRVAQRAGSWFLWNSWRALLEGCKVSETPFIDGMTVPIGGSV